jgi:hypothetical protein
MEIRNAETAEELKEVHRLTHDAYVEQGYCAPRADGLLLHYSHLERIPETTVFVAKDAGRIVGSNSLTLDGPCGLHVDQDFKTACDLIRAEGRPLAASWRIVVSSDYRAARTVVFGLIAATVRAAVRRRIETCVFTFNPRHESVYRKILNMTTVAHAEETRGLKNAPAVFMRCDFERLPARWLTPMTTEAGVRVKPAFAATERGISAPPVARATNDAMPATAESYLTRRRGKETAPRRPLPGWAVK